MKTEIEESTYTVSERSCPYCDKHLICYTRENMSFLCLGIKIVETLDDMLYICPECKVLFINSKFILELGLLVTVQELFGNDSRSKKNHKHDLNDPCACESGKKYKNCCARKLDYIEKLSWEKL